MIWYKDNDGNKRTFDIVIVENTTIECQVHVFNNMKAFNKFADKHGLYRSVHPYSLNNRDNHEEIYKLTYAFMNN